MQWDFTATSGKFVRTQTRRLDRHFDEHVRNVTQHTQNSRRYLTRYWAEQPVTQYSGDVENYLVFERMSSICL